MSGEVATPRSVWRLREFAVCVALTAVAFLQRPGLIVADTKIDLVLNPSGWLQRSLHLWDPANAFGQLQNQAYGYLWPMGPFFAGGAWLGVPPWVIQRLWWAVLFCVAFTGIVRLANRLNLGTPATRIIAGIAFALSPRVLTEVGSLSVEAWPTAVAPWVLVPLIGLANGASLRRSVTLSALAVACAGGVNATAVFAVVPLAVLWLLTLTPTRRRLTALGAWLLAVACATAWWLVPLFVLGAYSPPFLDYIETASATTGITDVVTVLRGASHWVAYLGSPFGPAMPAGARLAVEPPLIAATVVVAALGVAGLSRRSMPHRAFLVTGLLLGLALVGLGHVSELPGTFAATQRAFLDGIGAPLRNVHKFDVLLRVPLVLGLAHLLGVLLRAGATARRGFRYAPVPAAVTTAVAVIAIAVAAVPAFDRELAPTGGFASVPRYWLQASAWLDQHAANERVLVVPGSRFANYQWGSTVDEISQPLLTGPAAVRNAIPLTPATTIRLLDSIDGVLANGSGSDGLADLLARSGVNYLLLRSDLDYGASGSAQPLAVRQALQRSPGLSTVVTFGPLMGSEATIKGYTDHGLGIRSPALEVFHVDRRVSPVVAYDASDTTTVVGGPESLLQLAAAGQLPAGPTVLAGDVPHGVSLGPVVITDGMRRRDIAFGADRDTASATLTADEANDAQRPAHDYLPAWGKSLATSVTYTGISSITATSSWAQAGAPGGARPEHQPFAALDGDPATSWMPLPGVANPGQSLEIALDAPARIPYVGITFDVGTGALPTRVTVDAGAERSTVQTFGAGVIVTLPGVHATRTVRITVEQVLANTLGASFGISEIAIPGVKAQRTLTIPDGVSTGTTAGVVVAAAPSVPACFFLDDQPRCSAAAARASEDATVIDRTMTLPSGGTFEPKIWATPRPGAALNAVLDHEIALANPLGIAPSVTASSSAVDEPAARPGVVLDGDPATAWSPMANDTNPMLTLSFLTPRTVTGVQITLPKGVAATRPGVVRVVGDDATAWGFLDDTGVLRFGQPMHTDTLSIFLVNAPSVVSYDSYTTRTELLPVAVGEVTVLPGFATTPLDLTAPVSLACGSGPTLTVGTTTVNTRLVGTRADLMRLRETLAEPCTDTTADKSPTKNPAKTPTKTPAKNPAVSLTAGTLHLVATASTLATATRVSLAPHGTPSTAAPAASPVRVTNWSTTHRRVSVEARPVARVLAVRENTNPGWQATAAGRVLAPIVVDGWQQGWLLPAGTSGEIVLTFTPNGPYQLGLAGGAVLVLMLVALAAIPVRRRGSHEHRIAPSRRGLGPASPFLVGGAALVVIGGAIGGAVVLAALVAGAYRINVPARPGRRGSGTVELWLPAIALLVGGWWSLTVDNAHQAVGPQLAGLVTVGGLWLSICVPRWRRAPGPRPTATPALQRPFHHVETHRGQDQSTGHGEGEQPQRVLPERWAEDRVDQVHDDRVPQEQSKRDGADPLHDRPAEQPVQ